MLQKVNEELHHAGNYFNQDKVKLITSQLPLGKEEGEQVRRLVTQSLLESDGS